MILHVRDDIEADRIRRALASEGLAIRTEIKHGDERHVLTESPASGANGTTRGHHAAMEPVERHTYSPCGLPPAGADRHAHDTGRLPPRTVGYCEDCGQPCTAVLVDFGHGWTEHFGSRAYDTNKQWVSDCCDAPIYEDEDMTIEVEFD